MAWSSISVFGNLSEMVERVQHFRSASSGGSRDETTQTSDVDETRRDMPEVPMRDRFHPLTTPIEFEREVVVAIRKGCWN